MCCLSPASLFKNFPKTMTHRLRTRKQKEKVKSKEMEISEEEQNSKSGKRKDSEKKSETNKPLTDYKSKHLSEFLIDDRKLIKEQNKNNMD